MMRFTANDVDVTLGVPNRCKCIPKVALLDKALLSRFTAMIVNPHIDIEETNGAKQIENIKKYSERFLGIE